MSTRGGESSTLTAEKINPIQHPGKNGFVIASTHNKRKKQHCVAERAAKQANDVARAASDNEAVADRVNEKAINAVLHGAEDAVGGCNWTDGAPSPVAQGH